jgi:hypothetical protein
MNTRTTRNSPVRLERLQERFETWRQTHPPHSRIADSLWNAAVKAAVVCGIHRTARALRVNYYALKKRLEGTSSVASVTRKEHPATTFVELPPLISASSGECTSGFCECTLEWEDAGGGKLRLHFPGVAVPDLAALCRSLRP